MRIMLTGAGCPSLPPLADAFAAHLGADNVVLADCRPDAVGLHTGRYAGVVLPRADNAGYADALARECAARGVDWVVPTVDEELVALAKVVDVESEDVPVLDLGERNVGVMISHPVTVRLCDDKLYTYALLGEAGVGVPALAFQDRSGGSILTKARRGRGGHGRNTSSLPSFAR